MDYKIGPLVLRFPNKNVSKCTNNKINLSGIQLRHMVPNKAIRD